jgi:hypothetical protein
MWRRLRASVERTLGKLPALVLVPTAGAFVGTAWSVGHPSEIIKDGLVVAEASTSDVLLGALVGGIVGLMIVGVLIALWEYLRYRVTGDPVWKAGYGDAAPDEKNPIMFFELRCVSEHPVHHSTLGAVECVIKTPSGPVWSTGPGDIRPGYDGSRLMLDARFPVNPERGRYGCRWYSSVEGSQLAEVARGTIHNPLPTTAVDPPADA